MNMENHPSIDELRELIRASDDRAGHHVLWVAKDGEVHVSRVPKDKSPVDFEEDEPEMQLRLEAFEAGNDYVGPEASDDDDWMNQLFEALTREWPKAKGKRSVEYVDQF